MSNLVAHALVTLNQVQEALEISSGPDDARLNGFINRATDIIESYCGRRFISTTYTNEVYSGDGSQFLELRNFPVTTLSQLQMRTGDFSAPNWETIDTALYQLKTEGGQDRGIIYLASPGLLVAGFNDSGFIKGTNNFRTTYTAGYAFASLPNDLQEVCIEIVSYLFNRRKATPGMRSETLGRYSYTMEPSGGASIIKRLGLNDILDLYRTPVV